MLQLQDINKSYTVGSNSLHVLKGIDLEIGAGEMVSIMGPSGSGKSTLLNILGILDSFDSGSYRLGDQLIDGLTERRAARFRNQLLGFVFQSFNLIPFKTALENVALPLYYRGVRRKKRNAVAAEYLERVGLAEWSEHLPSEMSGGQQQRIAIARALINEPSVILADEPTGALDTQTSREVIELLHEINAAGTTVVIVTHEHEISEMTDRVIHLRDGVIGEDRSNGRRQRNGAPPSPAADTSRAEASADV